MTVKVGEIISKIQLLDVMLKRKYRCLREEAEAELDHIAFLERHLTVLTNMTDLMRRGRYHDRNRIASKRQPSSLLRQSELLPNKTEDSFRRKRSTRKGNLSNEWRNISGSRSGSRGRMFSSVIETSPILHLNQSTQLGQAGHSKMSSYLNNIYQTKLINANLIQNPTNGNFNSQSFKRKHTTDSSGIGALVSPKENKPRFQHHQRLETSKSAIRFHCDADSVQSTENNIRDHRTWMDQVSPIHHKSDSIGAVNEIFKERENRLPAKPSFNPSKSRINEVEICSLEEFEIDSKGISKQKSTILQKNSQNKEIKTAQNIMIQSQDNPLINLKRRDTTDGKYTNSGQKKISKILSPSRLLNHNSDATSNRSPKDFLKTHKSVCTPKMYETTKHPKNYGSKKSSSDASHLLADLRKNRENLGYANKKISSASHNKVQIEPVYESPRLEDQVKLEDAESDKKTEKKTSPNCKGTIALELLMESPQAPSTSQNLVIKEMSHCSEFTSRSNADYSVCTNN